MKKYPMVYDTAQIGAKPRLLHNSPSPPPHVPRDQRKCLWDEAAVLIDVLVVPHLAASAACIKVRAWKDASKRLLLFTSEFFVLGCRRYTTEWLTIRRGSTCRRHILILMVLIDHRTFCERMEGTRWLCQKFHFPQGNLAWQQFTSS